MQHNELHSKHKTLKKLPVETRLYFPFVQRQWKFSREVTLYRIDSLLSQSWNYLLKSPIFTNFEFFNIHLSARKSSKKKLFLPRKLRRSFKISFPFSVRELFITFMKFSNRFSLPAKFFHHNIKVLLIQLVFRWRGVGTKPTEGCRVIAAFFISIRCWKHQRPNSRMTLNLLRNFIKREIKVFRSENV